MKHTDPIISGINIIGWDGTREIHAEKEFDANGQPTGRIANLTPIEGSERSFISLQLPNGRLIRAEIASDDFENHILPTLIGT